MATRNEAVREHEDVDYDMDLAGRRVRQARQEAGISAIELAEILTRRTPDRWSHDMVRNLESGRRRIDPPLLRVLGEALGQRFEFFLYRDLYAAGAEAAQLSRVSSDELAKVLPFRKPRQRAGRPIERRRPTVQPVG